MELITTYSIEGEGSPFCSVESPLYCGFPFPPVVHLVLGKANPERMNGVNQVVHQLVTAQCELGIKAELWGITPNPVHNYPPRLYETRLFKASSLKWQLDHDLRQAIMATQGNEIFHLHGGFIPEFLQLAKLLRSKRLQYLYTPHGAYNPVALQKNAWVKRIWFHFFERPIIQGAQAVHFVGRSSYENFKAKRSDNAILIPNGIRLSEIPPFKERKNKDIHFGTCGRIDIHTKGLDILIAGFKEYLKNGGNGYLQVIGSGKELGKLRRLAAELAIGERIKFCGALFGREKYHALQNIDVFIQPSRNEGFPVAVLEAAAMQLPCIVSEHTNTGEYIRKYGAGWVLSQNNPADLARSLHEAEDLFWLKKLAFLGDNALQMIRQEFEWKYIARRLLLEGLRIPHLEASFCL